MANANGQKRWWFVGLLLTVAGIVFGAGGVTYTTRDAVLEHGKCIEALRAKTAEAEVAQARIDERLKAIEAGVRRIEDKLEPRP